MSSGNLLKVIHIKRCFLLSNNAEPGPPLGTILGNLGVNSAKFCKDFNEFTKHLPSYFVLKVRILVFENRTFSFFVKAPSTSFILSSLKFEKAIKVKYFDRMHMRSVFCIRFNDLLKLSKFKFFSIPADKSLFMI